MALTAAEKQKRYRNKQERIKEFGKDYRKSRYLEIGEIIARSTTLEEVDRVRIEYQLELLNMIDDGKICDCVKV